MYNVSNDYVIASEAPLRNPSYVKIVFGLIDPDAVTYSAPTDNGHLYYSAVEQFDSGVGVPKTYQTLELNRFVLDGTNPLSKDTDVMFQGYVGDEISNDVGEWVTKPTVTVNFSNYVTFPALTFTFDGSMNNYPSEFKIQSFNGNTLLSDEIVNPTKGENWIYEYEFQPLNKLVFTFLKSNVPHRRARIGSVYWGYSEVLSNDDILNCELNHDVDVISTSLPTVTFSFTIFDTNKSYDPDAPNTLWNYLESNQPVAVNIGLELDNGTIEWLPIGNFKTTGEVSVGEQGVATELSFSCTSPLDLLDDVYINGAYSSVGKSLYDLAMEVATFAEIDDTIILDQSLKTINTKNPLPDKSVKECLQLIANAGQCTIDVTRTGAIQLKKYTKDSTNFEYYFDKMLGSPTVDKIPVVRDIISSYNKYTVEATTSELANIPITSANETDVTISYNESTNQSYSVSGLTVHSIKYYARRAVLNCTGTGNIIISGYGLASNQVDVKSHYNELGKDCAISNELLDNYVDVLSYCDWLYSYFSRRNTYSFTDRGYLEIDPLDDVSLENNFSSYLEGTVISHRISFDGAIEGGTKIVV